MDRRVAASQGIGVLRRLSLPARRLPALHLRTDDYGKTWTRLTDGKNGIPADWPTRVVREDPDREGLLYAGTEFGMFISFDNGAHWQPFQLNMPRCRSPTSRCYHKDLVVVDAGPRDLDPGRRQRAAPDRRRRRRPTSRLQAARRLSHAHGPARSGPTIEYYLPSAPAGPVTIEMLDAPGAVVNTYNSERRRRRAAAADAAVAAAVAAAPAESDDPEAGDGASAALRARRRTVAARDQERRA